MIIIVLNVESFIFEHVSLKKNWDCFIWIVVDLYLFCCTSVEQLEQVYFESFDLVWDGGCFHYIYGDVTEDIRSLDKLPCCLTNTASPRHHVMLLLWKRSQSQKKKKGKLCCKHNVRWSDIIYCYWMPHKGKRKLKIGGQLSLITWSVI